MAGTDHASFDAGFQAWVRTWGVGRVQQLGLKVFQAAAGHPGEDPPQKLSLVVSPFSPPHPRLTVTSATWPWSSGTTPVRLSCPTQSSDSAS